jgi:hypothetical protein
VLHAPAYGHIIAQRGSCLHHPTHRWKLAVLHILTQFSGGLNGIKVFLKIFQYGLAEVSQVGLTK